MNTAPSASNNVAAHIREQAALRPASPAIITHEQVITYGQLNVAVGIVARHLRQNGVMPGQVVGISMGQNPLHVITLLSLAQVGAVSLPLHMAIPVERRALAASRFSAVCVVSGRNDMALPGLSFISLSGLPFDGLSVMPDTEIHPVGADAPFRIAISSGTSGDPKGMILTHGKMALRNRRGEPAFTQSSRTIPMDMNFITGFGLALRVLTTGAVVVLPRSMQFDHLLHAAVSHCATHVTLSPAQASEAANRFATDGIHCPSIVNLRILGGPLPTHQLAALRRSLSPHVYVGYGSTESGILSYASPEILDRQPTSVGQVCEWVKIEVVDGDDQPLPPGGTGQLRIRCEDQVSGYYRNDELTRKHFRDGWFYPGDLGRFDAEGLLYVEGRVDDRLNIGGLKINPEDIDASLSSHAAVVEAGAFLLVGDEGHEMLAAAVVLREADKLGEIQAHARARLGPLVPMRYFIVASLPRTMTGKLRRAELTAQFSHSAAGQQ